ncbi:MAG TPA: hypothetical protein P5044_11220, partial [bacterium]|nr:hypothetical protein [bacterium]
MSPRTLILTFLISQIFLLTGVYAQEKTDSEDETGFVFGSYGRVQPATDLEGGSPKWVNIVGHGSRLEQGSYIELDFAYLFPKPPNGP